MVRTKLLMPMSSEKSDNADIDNRHEGGKPDHNEVKYGHDAPDGRFTRP
jgi:hypothetical protein